MSNHICAVLATVVLSAVAGIIVRNEDICGAHNGRRLYLELGEQGVLYAKNLTFLRNAPRKQVSRSYVTNSSYDQCSLELVTCPSCVIAVTFKQLALSHHCGDGSMMMDSPCRCDYVWISEPPYEDVSGTPFCGLYGGIVYKSSTRTLSIALLYSQSHKHAFTLEYTAERNRLHLKGTDIVSGVGKTINNTSGGILTSPFFPARYPRDLGMEYIITCPLEAPSCRVRVLFSDFQLASVSIMEFYDWNGQRLDVSSGARFRPPVIVSSGSSLLIRFYANGGTGLGYKAFYSFVIGHLYDNSVQPITDCGGYVENLGGAITMMDMVGEGAKTYDCVWLIRPPKNFLHMKTHMYLKVVTFSDMAGNTELTIKEGPTSALSPLEVLRHPASQLHPPRLKEHVAPVASGFHVSLRGTFGPSSRLAIAYTTFSYMDCFTGSDFLCQNHRCIPNQLNCDGFDHCGDRSDEPATCLRDWDVEPQDRKWHMNKANYYFPKIDHYPDLKTATLVFVASSLGLIILISALIVLLYRMGARARQQRELQSRLQTISELLDGARIDEITVSDDPPVYEAPPGYDEVVKVGLASEIGRRRKKKNGQRQTRSRSTPNQRSNSELEAQLSSHPTAECASMSRSSQTTPVPTEVPRAVPESPPPPYITPLGTLPRSFTFPTSSTSEPGVASCDQQISRRGNKARHAWQQNTSEVSSSPAIVNSPLHEQRSSSIDAGTLGAYLQARLPNTSQLFAQQSLSSQNASNTTNPTSAGKQNAVEHRAATNEQNCACEGACGCANDGNESTTLIERPSAFSEDNKTFCPKNAIIKLLGSSKSLAKSPESTNLNSASISAASTPGRTFGVAVGRSFSGSLSMRSRESCVTRISTVSSRDSYDRLHDEFEIVSETVRTLGLTSPGTFSNCKTVDDSPRIAGKIPAGCRSFSARDLEGLYESIKVLDLFLARRGKGVATVNRKELTASPISFRTPDHVKARVADATVVCENANGTSTSRVWHSTDDTFI